jgi:hypothetical protein
MERGDHQDAMNRWAIAAAAALIGVAGGRGAFRCGDPCRRLRTGRRAIGPS